MSFLVLIKDCPLFQMHHSGSNHNKVHKYFYEARKKGILFDVGHGAGSFSFKIANAALKEEFLPDTISTDMHVNSIINNQASMPEVMSRLLACGMKLDDIIKKSTHAIQWNKCLKTKPKEKL